MSVGRNWMLTIVVAVIVVAAIFLVWRQIAPGSEAVAAGSGRIQPQQYQSDFVESNSPHLLVDVRTPQEFSTGHIEGAVNIPVQSLAQRMNEIPQDQPVVLYCRSGNRSSKAAKILASAGYDQVYDLGGIINWQSQGLPVQ